MRLKEEEIEEISVEKKSDTIFNKYEHLRITENSKIVVPSPIVSIGDNTIITESNLCVISGQPKEGKSSFVYYIISQAILPFFGIINNITWEEVTVARNVDNKAVIHIDTEQAIHNHVNAYKNIICKLSGLDKPPDYFHSYNLRGEEIKECKNVIGSLAFACNQKYNGIHLIVIDGIADLLKNVNDEEESNLLVHSLEKLARNYKCPIIVIIHTNPGSTKQRGHLGSQLQRKAESVLLVKKEGDKSYVEPQFLRNASNNNVPLVQFTFDKTKGYHTYAGIRELRDVKQEKEDDYKDIAEAIFSEKVLTNKEAINAIVNFTGKKDRTAQNYLTKMVELKYVCKTDKNYSLQVG